jgi:hypothetical protein
MFYHYLMIVKHLRMYPTEKDLEGTFCSDGTKYIHFFIKRIQAMNGNKLNRAKISVKKQLFTVDGVDC